MEGRRFDMKWKQFCEASVYGLLSVVSLSMCFFGALYPKYGLPLQSAAVYEKEEAAVREDEEAADETEETVVYKSLILERIKEWF